jgi:hypothetical protein
MAIAGMRKLEAPSLLTGDEPILITQEGEISGLYLPLKNPDQISEDLRRDLISAVGRHLAGALEAKGVREEEVLGDFDAFRRRRR